MAMDVFETIDGGVQSTLSITVRRGTAEEGHEGAMPFVFTVTRTGFTGYESSATFTVSGAGAHPATANDFVGGVFPSGTVKFAAGQVTRTITVNVQGDATVEPDEGFTVTLGNPSGVGTTIGVASATMTINNDELDRPSTVSATQALIAAGPETLLGTSGGDTINDGANAGHLRGAAGDDVVNGGGGNDIVYGNLGSDYCDGGEGADTVRGGQGDDVVLGGAGNDWLSGDRGDDTVTGGAGADIFHTFGDAGVDRVTDFSLAQGDRVMLDPGTTYSLSQVGADTVIDLGGGGQMVLAGVTLSSLTGDWIFGA